VAFMGFLTSKNRFDLASEDVGRGLSLRSSPVSRVSWVAYANPVPIVPDGRTLVIARYGGNHTSQA
jgi:hypothetical protein